MDIARYWKTIVDTLQDGLMVVGTDGRIKAMNPAAERLTGYAADELVGKTCRVLNCTGCQITGDGCGEHFCSLYVRGRVREKKCTITRKDGHIQHVLKNATVFKDADGNPIGAVETLTDISELEHQRQEIESLRKTLHLDDPFHGMVGQSDRMQQLFALIDSVAPTDAPVMIHGPSGAGKELVARALHEAGTRRGQPFIKVNCASLNENLLESELFGHVRGAFTGADQHRTGRFEAAHTGTLFLDEAGDIPPSTQVKLLRVLEEKTIERVGDHTPITVDVRIISATHQDLESLVSQGLFREDLFFRINVFPLRVPALVDRPEDIPLLVREIISRTATRTDKTIEGITPDALAALATYPWPGNVRELKNAIEYAFVICNDRWIDRHHLPEKIAESTPHRPDARPGPLPDDPRQALEAALKSTRGNRSQAARLLGISRVTVWKRMKKYGLIDPK